MYTYLFIVLVIIALVRFYIENKKITTPEEKLARRIKNRKRSIRNIVYSIIVGIILFLIMKLSNNLSNCSGWESNCFVIDIIFIGYIAEFLPVIIIWSILRYFI